MASGPSHFCAYPACTAIVSGRARCDKHATKRNERPRLSAQERGYDGRWQRVRAQYIAAHPLCMDCEKQGRTTPAVDVHHIEKISDAPERRLDAANLMALCRACHNQRTAKGE